MYFKVTKSRSKHVELKAKSWVWRTTVVWKYRFFVFYLLPSQTWSPYLQIRRTYSLKCYSSKCHPPPFKQCPSWSLLPTLSHLVFLMLKCPSCSLLPLFFFLSRRSVGRREQYGHFNIKLQVEKEWGGESRKGTWPFRRKNKKRRGQREDITFKQQKRGEDGADFV